MKLLSFEKLIEVLQELRSARLSLGNELNETDVDNLSSEYNLLFAGKNVNVIYSHELPNMLKSKFGIVSTSEQVNQLIPFACHANGMKCEPLAKYGEPDEKINHFEITLF